MQNSTYAIAEIKEIINAGGHLVRDNFISTLATDSRRIVNAAETLFFALSGRRDGHEFVGEAYDAGVRNFVVQHIPDGDFTAANFLVVNNVLAALQQLAVYHRNQYNLTTLGITGSNGKTIVKEWLYQLLSPEENIVRNPRSFNSQIGVPLSVWQIGRQNTLGIFEAGISKPGEMNALAKIIKPQTGIITHLGSAHNEGFESYNAKVIEKLKLFKHTRLLIYNHDQLTGFQDYLTAPKRFTWSRSFAQADLFIINETIISNNYYLRANYLGKQIECLVPFLDAASVDNAILCWATMLALGYSAVDADKRLEQLTAVRMRLELKMGINDCTIIDDSYNSDLQSLEVALNFLGQQNQHKNKTLILSDIFQSGLDADSLYRQLANMIQDRGITKLVGVGKEISLHKDLFNIRSQFFFEDTAALLQQISKLEFANETVLIKGSRVFEFEHISRALTQKAHETRMEINLNAMVDNLNFYRSKLYPGVKVMAMVKAFSYGSGTFEIANALQYAKVDYLAAAYTDEGVALREAGIKLPVMIMNPERSGFDKMKAYQLEPEIYSFDQLDELIKFIYKHEIEHYPIHLKVDTGMHRLGFDISEIDALCDYLEQARRIKVVSVFSHLAASGSPEHDVFTLQQMKKYEKAYLKLEKTLGYKFIKHISNTSAIIRWPMAQYDMVRLGIGLYGIDSAMPRHVSNLQPVATLKTSIAQIKRIPAGETVGYNRQGKSALESIIATVRIGYADGYLRAFGNGVGKMLVNGKPAPTIGNIAMDMCMIDITGLEAREGDEVIVFDAGYKIQELADQIGTIPYEILTNISQRVKRVYFYE